MLTIRMQRTGRKGHAMFRVVVQDSHLTPTSGKVVAQLGSFDPHAKTATLDAEKATFYLKNGAQPSDRAARLLEKQGVELPKWVKVVTAKTGTTRHPAKLRRNQPAEAVAEPVEEVSELVAETPAVAEAPEIEQPVEAEAAAEVVEDPADKTAEAADSETDATKA